MEATTGGTSSVEAPEMLILDTIDAFPTKAALYHPTVDAVASTESISKAAILFAAATGVPGIRHFASMAKWLASHGHPVLLFDYRFIGLSFPQGVNVKDSVAREEALKSSPDTTMSLHWTRDVSAAITLLHQRYCQSGRELAYIGNSHGAHLLPLAIREREFVTRAMFISAFTPYFGYFPNEEGRRERAKLIIDKSRELGYFLASRMNDDPSKTTTNVSGPSKLAQQAGLGFDLPLACGEEWMRWCHYPRYTATEHAYEYSSWRPEHPVVSISWDDDPMTSGDTLPCEQFLATLPQARHHILKINVQNMGPDWKAGCRHVDCFRSAQKEGAWEMMRTWAQTGQEPTGPAVDKLEMGGVYTSKRRAML